ncbi:SWIM zinc finger family protein [Methylobacterium sp. SI9]|uniref:SWIM zinc finger family protein n=1 Tax=Methylobacterium guangdongense TaxID=3138811 RepID=UPI00313ED4F8
MPRKRSRKLPDEAAIRALTEPAVFERGRAYCDDGAVSDLVARGDTISAAVAGSDVEPYRVTIRIADGQVESSTCTCPYEWDGACKHVVATLLAAAEAGKALEERPPLAKRLEALDRDALTDLILRRAALDPDLVEWIELECTIAPQAAPDGATIDPAPLAARARSLIAQRERRRDYWDGYQPRGNEAELHALVEKAVPFLEAGDGRNALRILEAVAKPLVEDWLDYLYEHDEETYLLFEDLGRMMAEAALVSDLDAQERERLRETLTDWQERIFDYGPQGFEVAILALETDWDDPALKAVLDGGPGPWPPKDNFESRALTEVMLRVLDGSGRDEAYMNLARAVAAQTRYAEKLVRLGRVAEAVAHARATFSKPAEALDLAQALDAAGRCKEALAVAEAGLDLGGPDAKGDALDIRHPGHTVAHLARWLRDKARGDLAVRAARMAFAATLSRADFHAAKTASGAAWPSLRTELLAVLGKAKHAHDRVAILLDEGLIAEAVAAAGPDTNTAVLRQLAEAAHASHPDWVIALAERHAAGIMDAGSAGQYAEAADWLGCAARAYDAAGRFEDWIRRIEDLIATHKRKHKLRPMLEALRAGG